MASYGGIAWIDVPDKAAVDAILKAIDDEDCGDAPDKLYARSYDAGQGRRIELNTDGSNYDFLPDIVVFLMRRTGVVIRALVALDHDEYGAEHIVLATRDGRVERVHHKYIYPKLLGLWPYRAGRPWRTDLPTIGWERGRFSGRLVDGPSARSALARLYGVPLGQIRAAGRHARRSHQDLGIIGEPFAPWLNALGIAWSGPDGEKPVLVRNRPVWQAAFRRYVLPELPGRWLVLEDAAMVAPIDLIACGVVRHVHGLAVVLHPLYVPIDGWECLPEVQQTQAWGYFSRISDAEEYMLAVAEKIRTDVLPLLSIYGSLEGFRRFCGERAADSDGARWLYLQAATYIILEQYDEADAALTTADGMTGQQAEAWYPSGASPAIRASLLAKVAEQRRLRGLPEISG
ncbi:hypothetical protein [Krasilnikovia sp. MM14-A1259]|uniref:hypothetical protein n=1 Tax=Krasilnikovia sp. MM14-A1259 TaxID=3373539 RepID=UPI00381CF25D